MKYSKKIRKKALMLFWVVCSATGTVLHSQAQVVDAPANQRAKYNFNSDWLLSVGDNPKAQEASFKDSGWEKVTLPHAFNEDEAFKLSIEQLTDTVVWYRKHFKLDASDQGKKVFLEFEGARFGAEVYVNGKKLALHENGVMAFGVDISDQVKFGRQENVLAVRADNDWRYKERATGSAFQWNDKNFNANYGGLPKNVFLHVADKLYQTLPLYSSLKTTGTYVYAQQINVRKRSAVIHAESEIKNEYAQAKEFHFESEIYDLEGKLVKTLKSKPQQVAAGARVTAKVSGEVEGLHFWTWGHGYLYDVYTKLYVDGKATDVVKTRTGFRKTAFRDGMVYLNDRVLQMKGYAQRTSNEWPAVGMSVPAWLSDYSNKLMVESNANLVRWMHVTPWKQDVESADRVGLIQAMPAGDAEKDAEGRKWEQRTELMRDAIIYNRNNPSILFYESGNDNISEEHMADMKAIRDQYDPHGGRAIGSREMLDSKIAEYGGEMLYINKSAKHPMWATEYCRDEGLRKYWDEYSYPFHKEGDSGGTDEYWSAAANAMVKKGDSHAYNHNQDLFTKELVTRWYDYYRVRPGTGTRVSSGGVKIIFSDSNTHYRGAENYRRSGVTDAMRIPKDGFYAHQVMWDGWVDIEKYHTHIVGHWNYTPEVKKPVYVVSSGEQVELFVNGVSKGFGERSDQFFFTFPDIQWEAGKIEAVSYDAHKKVLSRDEIKTAGEPYALKMEVMQAPDGLKADGADLALVQIEVVDKDGNRCPLANDLISFDLQGPAEWRGGIAQGPDNYILSKELPVECGVNRVLIRSTTKAGNIRLKASAKGLQTTSVSFASKPFETENGLSEYIAGDHLPSNLDRGEVVGGQSYQVTKRTVPIVAATAGSHAEEAVQSYDDNELSEWKNDGKLQTAWITYELERDAEISNIELKLMGWRTRSYPIQILIDGEEVFKGDTEKSLGYIGIPIKPTKGRYVTIRLIGNTSDKDAFGLVEVAGHIEGAVEENKEAKGQLRIVEVEIQEAVAGDTSL